ncbi:MAG: hypothetical protein ACTSO3_16915, partial [Candidatus Heimdallarchaeaceae archaeon]
MKGAFRAPIFTSVGVVLSVIVLAIITASLFGTAPEASALEPTTHKFVECKYHLDCQSSSNGHICIDLLEGSEPF